MDALSRQEYPAILQRLSPSAANSKLSERFKKIGKINDEVADWLQERRKIEETYAASLKKLARKPLPETGGDLGIFDSPWKRIVHTTDEIANSHSLLANRINQDVEKPLRSFISTNRESQGLSTTQGNLAAMAKDVDEAQHASDKLSKKGGKANAQKVDNATFKLQTANQAWDTTAPFIFETLQALDERRLNHLRDVLTQLETHETDMLQTISKTVEDTLNSLLEVDSIREIKNWAQATTAGKSVTERLARQQSAAGSTTRSHTDVVATPPPPTPRSTHTDNRSEHSSKQDEPKEPKSLRSRIGTLVNRRSSMSGYGGLNNRAPSPTKYPSTPTGNTRRAPSRDGRPVPSPMPSSNNLHEINRLSSLAESPTVASPPAQINGSATGRDADTPIDTNGVAAIPASHGTNGALDIDLSDVQPPPGPPPSHMRTISETQKDSEGFNLPTSASDPISQAQLEAAETEQQQFKLDIRNEPIQEQDADTQAALSNVANTLRSSQAVTPGRKVGTVRGRRDVRNTVYVPSANTLTVSGTENPLPPSPNLNTARAAALQALSSTDLPPQAGSDTTSIRSGHSLTHNATAKHSDMHHPGLNASIIETINSVFENGVPKMVKISGEIAFIHNKTQSDNISALVDETIRINNFPNLEAIGPNRTFIHPIAEDKPDEFKIDLSHVSSKPTVAFTYKVHIDDTNLDGQGPLVLKPTWKTRDDKLDLILEYSLHPQWGSSPMTFNNLVLVAKHEGGRATCQTKPSGTHLKEKSLVYWRLGDVAVSQEIRKVICRLQGTEGALPEPGHIEAKWDVLATSEHTLGSGISISKREASQAKEESSDPFADESMNSPTAVLAASNWVGIGMAKKFVSGKYEAR